MGKLKQLRGSMIPNEYRRIGRVLNIIQYIARSPGRWQRKSLVEHYPVKLSSHTS